MKYFWNLVAVLMIFGMAGEASAQSAADALRISATHFGGTARFNSMGGAFGALGGDFSAISVNPASIGVYRKSELTFTPSIYGQGSTSEIFGTNTRDSKLNFNFGNFGYAGASQSKSSTGWVSTGFAIGYNRQNNFHSRTLSQAINDGSSLADVYVNDLDGLDPSVIGNSVDPFGTNLAWETFLVDTFNGQYVSAVPAEYGQLQSNSVTSWGSVGETVFAFGGNYSNRLYIGASVGVQNARYIEQNIHEEAVDVNPGDSIIELQYFILTDNLRTTGTGYNGKLGIIYRVNKVLRLGAAFHTPTAFFMTDQWSSRMQTNFEGGFNYEVRSPDGRYNYRLITPYRAVGSAAAVISRKVALSLDAEFIDYRTARLRSGGDGYTFTAENNEIQNSYRATANIRAGAEVKLNPIALRAGYAFYASPYDQSIDTKGSRDSYSVGIGFRDKGFFCDAGYVLTRGSYHYYMYNPELIRPTRVSTMASNFTMTFGFRF